MRSSEINSVGGWALRRAMLSERRSRTSPAFGRQVQSKYSLAAEAFVHELASNVLVRVVLNPRRVLLRTDPHANSMKKTSQLLTLLAVGAAAFLISCGKTETTTTTTSPEVGAPISEPVNPTPMPTPPPASEKRLTIGYSDWPGWVAWEIGIKKGWFAEEGVNVQFEWMDYVASMEAYGAGKLDAVTMTNGDALVTGATAKPSVCVVINDFSNGNDMLIAKPGINSVKDLKGKKVALEEGFVPHLLVLKALEANGMSDADITIVNTPTNDTPQVLKSDDISAICAWQPSSGAALKQVAGSKPIYTSRDVPGLIYDGLFVTEYSLKYRRDDWVKVVKVWYRIVDYIKDEGNTDDVLSILSARVNVKPDEYEPFLDGTYILSLEEALDVWRNAPGLKSVYGSSEISDAFNVKFEVYKEPIDYTAYFDRTLTKEVAKAMK